MNKKSITIFAILIMITMFSLLQISFGNIYNGQIGGVPYSYDDFSKELYFSSGELPDDLNTSWDHAFRDEVTKVVFGGDVTTSGTTAHFFENYSNLQKIENLNKLDMSNVVNMEYMFTNCESLTALDLSGFKISDTTNITDMLDNTANLRELKLGSDVKKLGDASLPAIQDMNGFDSEKYTGKWQSVGSGTVEFPNGEQILTSEKLMNTYDGSHPDTYVWQPKMKLGIKFNLNGGSAPAGNPNAFDDTVTSNSYAYYEDIPASEFKPLLDVEPVKDDDLFSHWTFKAYDSEGNEVYDGGSDPWDKEYGWGDFKSDNESYIVFSAAWKSEVEKKLGIIFNLNGGSAPADNPNAFDNTTTNDLYVNGEIVPVSEFKPLLDIEPVKDGYEFMYWTFVVYDSEEDVSLDSDGVAWDKEQGFGPLDTDKHSYIVFSAKYKKMTRLSGKDRFATAVEVSKEMYPESEYVVIVNGRQYPDALSATPLAKRYSAPLLLVDKNVIPDSTKDEIERLRATEAIIVGGKGVVSESVESELHEMGLTTVRYSGKNRYKTALAVAERLIELSEGENLILVKGTDFPDALTVTSLALKEEIPILLTDPKVLSTEVKSFIETRDPSKLYIAGGKGAVSLAIEEEIGNLGIEVMRFSGRDRYETGKKIAEYTYPNPVEIIFANGRYFADAMVGGPLTTEKGGPIMLVEKNSVPKATANYITVPSVAKTLDATYIVGGKGVVSEEVENDIIDFIFHFWIYSER